MSRHLICTVGGAPEPVVRSVLEEPRPDSVIFVCSAASESSVTTAASEPVRRDKTCALCGEATHECVNPTGILARVEAAGFRVPSYRIVLVQDPQDVTRCLRDMEQQLTPAVEQWRRMGPDCTITVDPTGGTKCMSAALGLVARRWNCHLRYVGGARRSRRGVGVVENASEIVFSCDNPMDALGYQVAEDAITLCRNMNFAAATVLLETRTLTAGDSEARAGLKTLATLTRLFALWDGFNHRKAAGQAHQLANKVDHLGAYLSSATVEEIRRSLPDWRHRLDSLVNAGFATLELVEDLVANSARRMIEGRHDDAVARLYRAIEAMAQVRLATAHRIPSTARIPAEQLPPGLAEEWRAAGRIRSGTFQAALQDDYRILGEFGDSLAAVFRQRKLHDWNASSLFWRNKSILAHGFQAISSDVAARLWDDALALAGVIGIRKETLFRFPEILHRAA